MQARSIYFDYNATTPLDPAVRETMRPYWEEIYGNPSSLHHIGRRARVALDDARDRLSKVFHGKPSEVVFTSGGTESNNLAIFGAARLRRDQGRHLVTTPIEHHAVLHCFEYLARKEGFRVTYVPVDSDGLVSVEDVSSAIQPDTVLVSVMAANNEVGTVQPISDIGMLCRQRGVLFHTDAVQWFGKEAITGVDAFNADLVSLCAHKFHGPKGAGALYIRSPLLPDPILFGGGHENERRAGTENVPAIIGLVEAAERFLAPPVFSKTTLGALLEPLSRTLRALPGVKLQGHPKLRLSNTLSFTVEGCDSIALIAGLDLEGVCASSGSACSAGSLEPSHVLRAMGVPPNLANSFVRFSLGRDSTVDEVKYVQAIVPKLIDRIRR